MDGYEIREYPATNWVSSDSQAMEVYDSEESRELFMKLFLYISGGNRKAAKIPMTSPVSMEIHPGAGPNCKSNFTMSFYLDPKFQKNPPKPKDKDVYIESRPAMKVNQQPKILNVLKRQIVVYLLIINSLYVDCCNSLWRISN